jgi:hypothetical protein
VILFAKKIYRKMQFDLNVVVTNHREQLDKSRPVSARVVRTAVFTNVCGSNGFVPSIEGDQAPPMHMYSPLPRWPGK